MPEKIEIAKVKIIAVEQVNETVLVTSRTDGSRRWMGVIYMRSRKRLRQFWRSKSPIILTARSRVVK